MNPFSKILETSKTPERKESEMSIDQKSTVTLTKQPTSSAKNQMDSKRKSNNNEQKAIPSQKQVFFSTPKGYKMPVQQNSNLAINQNQIFNIQINDSNTSNGFNSQRQVTQTSNYMSTGAQSTSS